MKISQEDRVLSHAECLALGQVYFGIDFSVAPDAAAVRSTGFTENLMMDPFDAQKYETGIHARWWFVHHFSWSMPTRQIITGLAELLASHGVKNITELFAGLGYWAYLLEKAGISCTCYDSWTTHKHWTDPWHPVITQNANDVAIPEDHAVMLAWVPYEMSAVAILEKTRPGQLLIFITEGMGGCIADDDTHRYIEDNFDEVPFNYGIPQFNGLHDRLEIYRRKACPST